jgi:hypothetical protein
MKNHIRIIDWAGNVLFEGHYKDSEVDVVLDANRCSCRMKILPDQEDCQECDDTGYTGDFHVEWCDDDDRNVYEYINY